MLPSFGRGFLKIQKREIDKAEKQSSSYYHLSPIHFPELVNKDPAGRFIEASVAGF
jgi:hypothetical protein